MELRLGLNCGWRSGTVVVEVDVELDDDVVVVVVGIEELIFACFLYAALRRLFLYTCLSRDSNARSSLIRLADGRLADGLADEDLADFADCLAIF